MPLPRPPPAACSRCRAGEPAAPYLRRCISGALQHHLRDRVRLVRVPRRLHEQGQGPLGHFSLDAHPDGEPCLLDQLAAPEAESPCGSPSSRACRSGRRPCGWRSAACPCSGHDVLLTVIDAVFSEGVGNQKTLHRQIRSQFQGKCRIPLVAVDHEFSHGRTITWTLRAIAEGFREAVAAPEHIAQSWIGTSWIVEVAAIGTRDSKPFQATHLFLTSLRTTPETLLQLVRDRWSIEGWHWNRDTQLHEAAHRYQGEWRRRHGHVAHCSHEPVAAGWVPVNPGWLAGGDARHHSIAGDGTATARTEPMLRL